ncbi:cell division protein ZapC domain-containing protein [Algibacillus agarilyticus]|uniref:cell division protein ZapC domain-containing protein n=1 Tax=Algibacillus agarilyticus TaxID=2234133 RepID=UPI000DCFA547|nr:cell division protein ZapC domain-containing protein [Algibacillus agarilyticus]
MLRPNAEWYWFFDEEQGKLCTDMGDMVFVSPYSKRHIVFTDAKVMLSIDDLNLYTHFYNALEDALALPEPLCVQMALNALALKKFNKPSGPKSWFFEVDGGVPPGDLDHIVCLQSIEQQGIFLIVDKWQETSVVMLLSETMQLNGGKKIKQFESLNVLNDRLSLFLLPEVQQENYKIS